MFGSAAGQVTQPAQNDRKYYRLQTNFLIDIVVPSVAVPVPATLGDISEGGARVVSRSMLLRGTDIEFTLARDGKAPLKLLGTIASIDFKQENRMFHYGVKYRNLRPADSDAIYQFIVEQQRRDLQQKNQEQEPQKTTGSGGLRSVRERSAYRVEKNFPVRQASRDGSIFGRTVEVKEVKARQFTELQVHAKLLPAMEEVSGRYIYSVTFVRASNFVAEELQRYVHAAQLTDLNKTRHGNSGKRLL